MLITELVFKLKELINLIGDVHVEVRNEAGDFDTAEIAGIVNVSRKKDDPEWRIHIDV